MYDLIGDIHGHATELKSLLTKLGYQETSQSWQHPERKVIFLGDFVDRGPEQVETVTIARNMVESGNALAVMGNHEFNAVAWATPDKETPGEFLRPHTIKNQDDHQAFLDQVEEGSELHHSMIEWFKTLPLFLELDEFRVVHACWHPRHVEDIKAFVDDRNRVQPDAWPKLTREDAPGFNALEILLKGLEISLPEGHEFRDKQGNPRTNIRTRWWDLEGKTFHDVAMVPADVLDTIPHEEIPENILPGYDKVKPVFVGHYWLKGEPELLSDHIACLDYSVVDAAAGKLCAYRWDGKRALCKDRFCWVPNRQLVTKA